MKAATLMVQGTTSDAGKSLVVAALCRILSDKGIRVAPFKGQNMALNSFATVDGHEIGRAQALQAEAARIEPEVDMNPVLLKPTSDARSQVIVCGEVYKTLSAREYYAEKHALVHVVKEALDRLRTRFEAVIIEGAGSPAEINLKHADIANMGVAKMVNAPVILVGDIDRGGVFASLVGTIELLDEDERNLIKGLVINKFRGDATLLDPGIEFLENRTGIPFLGTIPYLRDLRLDSEDSLALEKMVKDSSENEQAGLLDIAVVRLPQISNFTDFDALMLEPGVNLRYVTPGEPIGKTDCIIVPGTKMTIADMKRLHETGAAQEIIARREQGAPVIGICGGYQMLGRRIEDPNRVESDATSIEGLGLLDCSTVLIGAKMTVQAKANVRGHGEMLGALGGSFISGYEIHMGETRLDEGAMEAFRIMQRGRLACNVGDGCVSADGLVFGTYIHGLFDNDGLRRALLDYLRRKKGRCDGAGSFERIEYNSHKQEQLDRLAKAVEESLDMNYIYRLIDV